MLSGVEENVAYIALGAEDALRERDVCAPAGHLDYIFDCCEHAAMLEELYREYEDRFCGVFAYEVAEPFGKEFGLALLDHRSPNAREIATRLVNEVCGRN